MSNTFGKSFSITTYGESHGNAVGCVIDGCPSGLNIKKEDIQKELDRRKPGQSPLTTPRAEEDTVEILSGIFEDKTLGTPISMIIRNKDADSSKYFKIQDTPRPGHADLAWREKFGNVDFRGGGRSSARETAARVAGGAVAKKLLEKFGIEIIAYAVSVRNVEVSREEIENQFSDMREINEIRKIIESNPVRCILPEKAKLMENLILDAKSRGDSVGGVIEVRAFGVPPGIGEPVFDKINSDLAKALMSIPAIKGVEIGAGFELTRMLGSESNDEFIIENGKIKTATNNCGGILGGMSNGMPIIARIAVKPTASIPRKQKTVNIKTMKPAEIAVEGRHDPCIIPRAVPVAEAMTALVLADHGIRSGLIPGRLD
jgi:chorismate synthase